jgi:hypothetical protein
MFLRILYGAQVSLEVGIFATVGSVGLGVIHGSNGRLLPRLGRHGRLADDRGRDGVPVPALHHRAADRRRNKLTSITLGSCRPASSTWR